MASKSSPSSHPATSGWRREWAISKKRGQCNEQDFEERRGEMSANERELQHYFTLAEYFDFIKSNISQPDSVIDLSSIGCRLPFAELYSEVEFL
jgi:hypothetical protein